MSTTCTQSREREQWAGGGEREPVRRTPSGAASHTVYLTMAPGSVRAALMGCVVVIVATGGMILDKDQYDKVSRINGFRSGDLHLSPSSLTFRLFRKIIRK
jgi:hypothetical protein